MTTVPPSLAKRLRGAGSVFAARGFASARIEDVAHATGIPRATLYYHFRSKENLLAYVLQTQLDQLRDGVVAAVGVDAPVPERLRRVVHAVLAVMAADPAAARLIVDNLGGAGSLGDVVVALRSSFHEPVERLIAEGVTAGSLASVDPGSTAAAVFGAVVLTGLYFLVSDDSLDPVPATDQVCALVLDGLRAVPNERHPPR